MRCTLSLTWAQILGKSFNSLSSSLPLLASRRLAESRCNGVQGNCQRRVDYIASSWTPVVILVIAPRVEILMRGVLFSRLNGHGNVIFSCSWYKDSLPSTSNNVTWHHSKDMSTQKRRARRRRHGMSSWWQRSVERPWRRWAGRDSAGIQSDRRRGALRCGRNFRRRLSLQRFLEQTSPWFSWLWPTFKAAVLEGESGNMKETFERTRKPPCGLNDNLDGRW